MTLEIWMQMTFLIKYKLILGLGQQKKLKINNYILLANLTDNIKEKVVYYFNRVIKWSITWFNKWIKCTKITLKVCRPDY
jgi:hypothetical protein